MRSLASTLAAPVRVRTCALACAAALAAGCALSLPSGAIAAARHLLPAGSKTGTVVALSPTSVTIQAVGRRTGVINALVNAAANLTAKDYPYVWGGGHAYAGLPSVGSPGGPGYNGRRLGMDCSGAVAAVLAGAGLWPLHGWVPSDEGIIYALLAEHVIAPGVGTGADQVTIYDEPGVHIFLNIDGDFFGTSDGYGGGDPAGGPGWLDDAVLADAEGFTWDADSSAFAKYHVVPRLLRSSLTAGNEFTFQLPFPIAAQGAALQLGDPVQIGYAEASSGAYAATSIAWQGAATTGGEVTAVTPTSFTIIEPTAVPQTYGLGPVPALAIGLQVGDQVTVSSTTVNGVATAHSVIVTEPVDSGTPTTTTTPTTTPPGILGLKQ